MKQTYKTIDCEWLTKPTGDPFADAGGFAIEYLSERFPEKNILELIDYITKIYVEKWGGKLNAFFLNSKITQPAFQGSRKIEETLKYFEALIKETEPSEVGYCRITGQETRLFFGGRDNSIMTGSGTLINFHHFFQKGIALSKEALIRIHFVPFACQQLQGRIGLMQSNNQKISNLFVKLTAEKNLHEIGIGLSEGVAKSDFNKPANAIFDFVDYTLSQLQDFREGNTIPSLTLYHFTNFGASPEIQMYQLPAKVFLFYRTCLQPMFRDDWQRFVRSHYFDGQHKGAKYNLQTEKFELVKSKDTETIDQNFIPMISPLSADSRFVSTTPGYYLINPGRKLRLASTAEYISANFSGQNIIMLNHGAESADEKYLLSRLNQKTGTGRVKQYNILTEESSGLEELLKADKENIFILAEDNEANVSVSMTRLNTISKSHKIKVIGLQEYTKMKSIDVEYLHNTNLHYLAPYFIDYGNPKVNTFIERYRTAYNSEPTQYSFQGYDIGLYFISSLGKPGRIFKGPVSNPGVDLLQAEYNFQKPSPYGGHINRTLYVIEYTNSYEIRSFEKIRASVDTDHREEKEIENSGLDQ